MGLHVKLTPEAEAEFKRQRKVSTLVALLLGILITFLLGIIFYLIGITLYQNTTESLVAYITEEPQEIDLKREKVNTNVIKRNPSSSSSATSPVVTTNVTMASFSVPEVLVQSETLTSGFGSSDGFGDGFGKGFGSGTGAGGVGLFGVGGGSDEGDVLFIIDYSQSMSQKNKIGLLKNELKKAIDSMDSSTKFELLFFAGPAWLGGSTIKNPNAKKGKSIITQGKDVFIWNGRGGAGNWNYSGDIQIPKMEKLSNSVKSDNIDAVMNTPLVWGTDWGSPFDLVFQMRKKPDTIVFLTDGAFKPSGSSMNEFIQKYGTECKRHNIKVNAIALLEPSARQAMEQLAEITGGEFGLINAKGEREEQPKGISKHQGY